MEMGPEFQQRIPQQAETDRPNLTGIPTQMKLDFEQRSGMSFDDVRVHYNSEKPAQFHALAYTQGAQIYIGPGQERSLSHELGHVIQQKAGRVRPTRWIRGQPVNDQPELEREADRAPVQCMAAPALWGVIQMHFDPLPQQRGCNCGYHAMARAIYEINKRKFDNEFVKNNLEIRLTTYAITNGYSVIGEAFDPGVLAQVGAEFCGADPFCKEKGISVKCDVRHFENLENLQAILDEARSEKGVILIPYFPDPLTMDVEINSKDYPVENAHWGVIDPSQKPYLYEGHYHGSVEVTEDTHGKLEAYNTDRGALQPELDRLLESNLSIKPVFSWDVFLQNGLPWINLNEAAVNTTTDKKSKAFPNRDKYYERVERVMGKIGGTQSKYRQKVCLQGNAIKVTA